MKNIYIKQIWPAALVAVCALSCKKNNNNGVAYEVSRQNSKVEWKGSAPDHFHVGSFKVTGGLSVNDSGVIKGGDFTIPIASIENYDLTVDSIRNQLLDHLKSPDFFNIAIHPNAEFHITKIEAYSGNDTSAVAGANYKVSGNFKMLDKTNAISFPAKITTNGDSLITEARLSIDRLKWGMTSFNNPTGGLYILPDIQLKLNVRSAKK
jgi:polyisoprenoid-binding protein YceI